MSAPRPALCPLGCDLPVDGATDLLCHVLYLIPERYRPAAIYLREHGAKPYLWTSSRENGLCSIDTFRKRYYRLLDAMPTVRRLNPHCCRHTYVTRLQARNVPMETIARLVGHGSIKVTDDYLHITPETLAQAANKLNG